MKISNDDRQNLDRLLDDELSPGAAAAMQARIDADPALRAEFDERQRFRDAFAVAVAGARTFAAPAGFAASVLGATRRLPDRRLLEEREAGDTIVRVCRRILIAAAVVVGLGCLWNSGLLRGAHDTRLEAAPNEVQQELERLDSLIEAEATGRTPK